jgi:hypothetical protein
MVSDLIQWSSPEVPESGAMSAAILEKPPLSVGTGAALCISDRFGALDQDHLIVPGILAIFVRRLQYSR